MLQLNTKVSMFFSRIIDLCYFIYFLIICNCQKKKIEKTKIINVDRYHKKYMELAYSIAELSHAKRKKVGSIIVKNNVIISDGHNGMPSGFENECEDCEGNTKWETLHSEANAITKLAKNGGISAKNSILYITLSPCKECAKLILQSGIDNVYYAEEYRDTSGVEFLKRAGINVFNFNNYYNLDNQMIL
jgi:dCMP deaminase